MVSIGAALRSRSLRSPRALPGAKANRAPEKTSHQDNIQKEMPDISRRRYDEKAIRHNR